MVLRPREVETVIQGQKMMEGVCFSFIPSHFIEALDETALLEQFLRSALRGTFSSAGAGVRICRTLGTSKLRNLDPFLMLDELRMPAREASAGFPDHPHRGFETCSIMFSGKMEHHDSVGNQVSMLDAANDDCTKRANLVPHTLVVHDWCLPFVKNACSARFPCFSASLHQAYPSTCGDNASTFC